MSLIKVSYSMIDGAPVNPLDFGAVCDGVTDDTVAIQAAIDFCIANNRDMIVPGLAKITAS
jgi:polygalacturonase